MFAYEFERVTTQARLVGAGTEGLGEDVSVTPGRLTCSFEIRGSHERYRAGRHLPESWANERSGADPGGTKLWRRSPWN
ncbi:MAG: hypothetical protein LC674_05220 [Actinobacteria bacterium]|nr:hypothetical protein [Actinomycetota bacterium]